MATRPEPTPKAPPSPPPHAPPKPRRRWLRRLFFAALALALLLAAAPHALGLDAVRTRVAAAIGEQLGVPCRIDRLGFSWFTGVAAEGLELGNPPGFPTDHPLLHLRRCDGDLGLANLLRGRFDLSGAITGLHLVVDQRADGSTNVEALGRHANRSGSGGPGSGSGTGSSSDPSSGRGKIEIRGAENLANLRLSLQLHEATLELRRDGQPLEALTELTCTVQKPFGSQKLTLDLDTRLRPLAAGDLPGRLTARLDADLGTQEVLALLTAAGLDLQRFRPLVDAFAPGRLAALAGVANGTLTAQLRGDELHTNGDLAVDRPRLAGPAFGPLALTAPRWQLRPTLRLAPAAGGGWQIAGEDFRLSLGFAELRFAGATATKELLRDRPGLGLQADFAVEDVLGMLPDRPDWLSAGGRLTVAIAAPAARLEDLATLRLEDVAATIRTAKGSTFALAAAGIALEGTAVHGVLQGGEFTLDVLGPPPEGAPPEGAPPAKNSAAGLRVDLRRGQRLATQLGVSVRDRPVQGSAAELLRYAVPLLAGLDAGTADFRGRADLEVALRGPLLRLGAQNWLQLLDEWSGEGNVGLREASVTPGAALRGLLQPLGALPGLEVALGDAGRLAIDSFSAPWTLHNGTLQTKASRWLAKGKAIGLSGTVHLDGTLDYGFDLSALLQGHRDGERVLAALGGRLPEARLTGTFAAPRLGLPDLAKTARTLLEQDLEAKGWQLLQKTLEGLKKKR